MVLAWVEPCGLVKRLAAGYVAAIATAPSPERDALLASIEQRLWWLAPVGVDKHPAPWRVRNG